MMALWTYILPLLFRGTQTDLTSGRGQGWISLYGAEDPSALRIPLLWGYGRLARPLRLSGRILLRPLWKQCFVNGAAHGFGMIYSGEATQTGFVLQYKMEPAFWLQTDHTCLKSGRIYAPRHSSSSALPELVSWSGLLQTSRHRPTHTEESFWVLWRHI